MDVAAVADQQECLAVLLVTLGLVDQGAQGLSHRPVLAEIPVGVFPFVAAVLHQHHGALRGKDALQQLRVSGEQVGEVADAGVVGAAGGRVDEGFLVQVELELVNRQRLLGPGVGGLTEGFDLDILTGVEGQGLQALLDALGETDFLLDGGQRGGTLFGEEAAQLLGLLAHDAGALLKPFRLALLDGDRAGDPTLDLGHLADGGDRIGDEHGGRRQRFVRPDQVGRRWSCLDLALQGLHGSLELVDFLLADLRAVLAAFEAIEEVLDEQRQVGLILGGGMGLQNDGVHLVVHPTQRAHQQHHASGHEQVAFLLIIAVADVLRGSPVLAGGEGIQALHTVEAGLLRVGMGREVGELGGHRSKLPRTCLNASRRAGGCGGPLRTVRPGLVA